ncbi:MAG TPA: cytochrome oxidase assembly protein, partial [Myxococcales bacterium]|nr:cytochrome oxidase assembly protein [Myxococcales bacterium]
TSKTIVELTHRLTSGLSLLFSAGLYWRCRVHLPVKAPARRGAKWALVFFFIEAAIGAALVKFKLVEGDTSTARAVVIALHLSNTFFLLTALLWTTLNLRRPRKLYFDDDRAMSALMIGGLGALIVVGASGGVTALGDTLFPAASLAEGIAQDLSPTAHFLIRLRVLHPLLAVGAAMYWLALTFRVRMRATDPTLRYAAIAVSTVVTAQIICGVINLLWLAPTWLQLAHLALADALWLCAVWLCVETLGRPLPIETP